MEATHRGQKLIQGWLQYNVTLGTATKQELKKCPENLLLLKKVGDERERKMSSSPTRPQDQGRSNHGRGKSRMVFVILKIRICSREKHKMY